MNWKNKLAKSKIFTGSDDGWKFQYGDRWEVEKEKYIREVKERVKKCITRLKI